MTMQRNKGKRDSPRLMLTRVALGILALLLLGGTPASTWIPTWISSWVVELAHAQARVRSEFRQALSPYGELAPQQPLGRCLDAANTCRLEALYRRPLDLHR
jgi:hypothetical protein